MNGIFPLGLGLAIKWVFDDLSGARTARVDVWTALALMGAIAIIRMANSLIGTYTFSSVWQSIASLLVRNLMASRLRLSNVCVPAQPPKR